MSFAIQKDGYFKFCQLKEEEIKDDIIFSVQCIYGKKEYANFFIHEKHHMFLSRNYIKKSDDFNLREFLNTKDSVQFMEASSKEHFVYPRNIYYGRFKYDKFQKKYPEVKLKEYMESGGKNPLLFLLSENNDSLIELLGKSGLGYLSNNINNFNINYDGKNIKEIFGLSIKAMRNLNSEEVSESLTANEFKNLKEAYARQKQVLEKPMSIYGIQFLSSLIGNKGKYIEKDTERYMMDYLRYINKLNETKKSKKEKNELYEEFIDYTNMCIATNLWPEKRFPEIKNIPYAHDVMINYYNERKLSKQIVQFDHAIRNKDYYSLIDYPATDFFKKSEYVMLMPRSTEDLVNESYQMRNCVKSYINAVSFGRTYILFLRKKKNKSKSCFTVEVSSDYNLIQIKGIGNSAPTEEAIEWSLEWAKIKNVNTNYCNDIKISIQSITMI